MNRRILLLGLMSTGALAATTGTAMAASFAEDIVAQLTKLGFSNITTETTWLGRIKILASRSDGVREIILNPRTGEILRDAWMPLNEGAPRRTVLDDVGTDDGGSGHDGSGSGDDGGGDTGGDGGGGDNSGGDGGSDGGGDHSGSGSGDDGHSGHGGGESDDDGKDDDGGGKGN